ncbi:MAG: hypothetical protein L3J96_01405 [Thermoplasmata archaeon]|nr:hypothetical protein [Thermoplasmata archaeon]
MGFPGTPHPAYWAGAASSDGRSTVRAVGEIRRGLHYYRIYLVLSLVASLALAGVTLATGVPQSSGLSISSADWYGNNSSSAAGALGGGGQAAAAGISAVAVLVFVIGFVLLLVAFLAWRGGVKQLEISAVEHGGAHVTEAAAAARDYTRALFLWITELVAGIVAVVLVTFEVISATIKITPAGMTNQVSIDYARLHRELLIGFAAVLLISWVFGFLVYYFASRSIRDSFSSMATPAQRELLGSGRQLVLVGASLTILSALSLVYYPLALLAVVPFFFLIIGFSRLLEAYDSWLAAPVWASRTPAFR